MATSVQCDWILERKKIPPQHRRVQNTYTKFQNPSSSGIDGPWKREKYWCRCVGHWRPRAKFRNWTIYATCTKYWDTFMLNFKVLPPKAWMLLVLGNGRNQKEPISEIFWNWLSQAANSETGIFVLPVSYHILTF